jgi:adenylate cyclase
MLRMAAALGLATGVLGLAVAVLPFGIALEENVGLSALFELRGPRPAPPEVVVVSIDTASTRALDLPSDPARWPRALHARLTESLAAAGASVIAFDIFFGSPRGEDDTRLADAMRRAGSVVLVEYLARETVPVDGGRLAGPVVLEQRLPPTPPLHEAALATAPFPLPKVPVRVSQYWTFKPGAGGAPTLPVVAFQTYALDAYDDLVRLVERASGPLAADLPTSRSALRAHGRLDQVVARLRQRFEAELRLAAAVRAAAASDPELAAQPARRARLDRLLRLYDGPHSRYLNFYGPPGSVRTVSYHEVIDAENVAGGVPLAGRAVFVGMSDSLRPEQRDTFHTVFSGSGDEDLSGVEIAATAFANLLDDRPVRPAGLGMHLLLLLGFGLLLGLLSVSLAPQAAAAAVGIACGLYLAAAYAAFVRADAWWPLAVPLLVQAPLAFVGGSVWRYAESNRERLRVRQVFSRYLPDDVIDGLLAELPDRVGAAVRVYGICLFTDAERYTRLAESLEPTELADLMNRYYAAIFEPIRRRGGFVSDVIGDATLAIWAAPGEDRALRLEALRAACEIAHAIDRFGATSGAALPTRIGLCAGPIVLGHVGAIDHFEYRAVGDIVNTACRIQGLNKQFGTRILASEEVVSGIGEFLTRRLGSFLLAGKSKPVAVHEVVCAREAARPEQVAAAGRFAEALAAYEGRAWDRAAATLSSLVDEYGEDRAARFYANACDRLKAGPPEPGWDGVVRMDEK